jgi:single-strand DNA-binding protein
MNITMLVGTLTKDAEMVQGTEKPLCKLNIAVRENYTKEDGTRPSQFFNVAVWGKVGESCGKFLKKGSRVAIVGKIQNRSWEQDGVKRYATEVVATEVEFLSTPKSDEVVAKPLTEEQANKLLDDDGLPF